MSKSRIVNMNNVMREMLDIMFASFDMFSSVFITNLSVILTNAQMNAARMASRMPIEIIMSIFYSGVFIFC